MQPTLGRNLTYSLVDTLGTAIVTGVHKDTGFPTEAELAVRYGVSRSVIREAVKMLTAKGLLSARPRQGTTVQPVSRWNLFDTDILNWLLEGKFSIDLLRQFSELRAAIEPEASALAARNAAADHLAPIATGLARMAAAERGEDDALDADIAFHDAILEASQNPYFMQFREMITVALKTSIRFTNRIKGHTASVPQHRSVYNAIVAGNPDLARRRMRSLIEDAIDVIDRAAARMRA